MKIYVNTTVCDEGKLTGIERYALNISRELAKIDNEVVVFRGKLTASRWGTTAVSPALLVANELFGDHAYAFRALWDQTAFRYHLWSHQVDLAYFPIPDGMYFPSVPQIVTIHDLHYLHFDKSMQECRHEINLLRRKLYQYKMPHILKRSAAVVAVSQSTKHDIVASFSINPDKIHVVYNGYNEERFRVVENAQSVLSRYGVQQGGYFLFVGSILRHKNVIRLVQAFAALDNSNSLIVAGANKDQEYLNEILSCARGLRLSNDRFRYLEFIPDEDLPYLYNGAISFVLPSLHEGFGVPIIEAMACGTPVITSNCSAMPEVAGDATLLVDPYSVESIAAGMQEILDHPQRAEALRTAGLERAKMFRWSYSAQKLYEVCKMVSEQ